jgi:protochlorophyllide reductase
MENSSSFIVSRTVSSKAKTSHRLRMMQWQCMIQLLLGYWAMMMMMPRPIDAFAILSTRRTTTSTTRMPISSNPKKHPWLTFHASSSSIQTTTTRLHATNQNHPNRRDVVIQTAGTILSTMILLGSNAQTATAVTGNRPVKLLFPQTILITGCNSGIGLEACYRLADQAVNAAAAAETSKAGTAQQPLLTLILACRTQAKADGTAQQIRTQVPNNNNNNIAYELIPMECDLADLSSIRAFAEQLPKRMKQQQASSFLDVVCYNAGISRNADASTPIERTRDGFESTVGINHFGHFYLHHFIAPYLRLSSTTSAKGLPSRIVITASTVHDPISPGGRQGVPATLGQLQGLEQLGKQCEMIDGGIFNADKAYKDSKLCNVLFARELQRRLGNDEKTKDISVNAFSPGLIVSTGLFRDQNPFFVKVSHLHEEHG